MAKILHLTIKKKWFDMIRSGEKKEEYRELKLYWGQRLISHFKQEENELHEIEVFKEFDLVRFKNGYRKDSSVMDVDFEGIEIRQGKTEWGAEEGQMYFVIKLGIIRRSSVRRKGMARLHSNYITSKHIK